MKLLLNQRFIVFLALGGSCFPPAGGWAELRAWFLRGDEKIVVAALLLRGEERVSLSPLSVTPSVVMAKLNSHSERLVTLVTESKLHAAKHCMQQHDTTVSTLTRVCLGVLE